MNDIFGATLFVCAIFVVVVIGAFLLGVLVSLTRRAYYIGRWQSFK